MRKCLNSAMELLEILIKNILNLNKHLEQINETIFNWMRTICQNFERILNLDDAEIWLLYSYFKFMNQEDLHNIHVNYTAARRTNKLDY